MNRRPIDIARVLVGHVKERPGGEDHPFIVWCLEVVGIASPHDEIPWCSAFLNGVCFLLDIPRSGSAAARSWLKVGTPVPVEEARVGFDVVIFQRGDGPQPGPEVIDAPGHVAFFSGLDGDMVQVIGGNQGDAVTLASFPKSRVLGVRRILNGS